MCVGTTLYVDDLCVGDAADFDICVELGAYGAVHDDKHRV